MARGNRVTRDERRRMATQGQGNRSASDRSKSSSSANSVRKPAGRRNASRSAVATMKKNKTFPKQNLVKGRKRKR